jgi:hypothetical protein
VKERHEELEQEKITRANLDGPELSSILKLHRISAALNRVQQSGDAKSINSDLKASFMCCNGQDVEREILLLI